MNNIYIVFKPGLNKFSTPFSCRRRLNWRGPLNETAKGEANVKAGVALYRAFPAESRK